MPALEGMRILDLTQYEAGPSATQALAWMGADVVKVERPGKGDPGRGGPFVADSAYFLNWNANKRSLALDVGQPEGRELFLELLPRFDAVVENFGPGVIDKLDLGWDVLRTAHPGVIFASVKGFGSFGPYADYKCFDGIAQAASGAFSMTGMPDGPPLLPGATLGDVGTGMQLALAICAAYIQRLRTGVGQRVELSMQEAMTYYLRTRIAMGAKWGEVAAERAGHGRGGVYNLFPTAPFGPNDYVFVMAITEAMFIDLARAIGQPELLEDPRYVDARSRARHGDELYAVVAEWAKQHDKHEAMRILGENGVPASAVLDTQDLFQDPHLLARGFVHQVDHGELGHKPLLGWPARMSDSEVALRAAPHLGEHTEEVLAAELSVDDAALARLREAGVIA
ncbi:MAG: formyl-CoA transferase [Acidimicrobiia bacterium]|nr:formyl-CoA transferase [Acidimicrobiia bacterium]